MSSLCHTGASSIATRPDGNGNFTTLAGGTPVIVRPIVGDDAIHLTEGLARLSEQSRTRRFLYNKAAFSERELRHLTHPDGCDHIALVLGTLSGDGHEIDYVAVARCIRDPHEPHLAEVAFVTIDEWQGHGIGKILLHSLASRAKHAGITHWKAISFADNHAARNLLRTVGRKTAAQYLGAGIAEETYEIRGNLL